MSSRPHSRNRPATTHWSIVAAALSVLAIAEGAAEPLTLRGAPGKPEYGPPGSAVGATQTIGDGAIEHLSKMSDEIPAVPITNRAVERKRPVAA